MEESVDIASTLVPADPALAQAKLDVRRLKGAGRRRLNEVSGLLAEKVPTDSVKEQAGFNSAL